MERYCFENMFLRNEFASVGFPVKAAYNKPLTRNQDYVYKSRIFRNKRDGCNRPVDGLENRNAQ
mgnify:CR=1 FL=1